MGYWKCNKYKRQEWNGGDKVVEEIDQYRGMLYGRTKNGEAIYTSAKDIGNIAAGYMAGVHGIPWGAARMEFDKLQSKQDGHPSVEKASTQNAEYYGWLRGYVKAMQNPASTLGRWTKAAPTIYKRFSK